MVLDGFSTDDDLLIKEVMVVDDISTDDDLVSSSSSSPRSVPIDARVSVKSSISSRSGTSA